MPDTGPASSSFTGSYTATTLIVIVCSALAGYNAIELLLLLFTTFSRYRGLYFWSLFVSTFAIVPYALGLCIFYFGWARALAGYIINNIGWIAMVTGQSVVLYSRLGVVLGPGYDALLKFVKYMIMVDGFLFYVPITVVVFGMHYGPPARRSAFALGYKYAEKIQMTGFCIQEFLISGIYMWRTIDIIKARQQEHTRRVMWQLLMINVVIVCLDVGLLVLEYRNLFVPEVAFKGLAYSVKLKLEFAILSKLVEFSRGRRETSSAGLEGNQSFIRSSIASPAAAHAATVPSLTSSQTGPRWLSQAAKFNADLNAPTTAQTHSSSHLLEDGVRSDPATDSSSLTKTESNLLYADAVRGMSK